MAAIRPWGNAAMELRLIAIMRAHGIIQPSPRLRRTSGLAARRFAPGKVVREAVQTFRVKPDFVFRAHRLAVFVDGCFWHGCPIHGTQPRQNAKFWREKIARNRARDRLVNRTLRAMGWRVFRIWEHELRRKNERRLLGRLRRAELG